MFMNFLEIRPEKPRRTAEILPSVHQE